jgi:hypothetical protein
MSVREILTVHLNAISRDSIFRVSEGAENSAHLLPIEYTDAWKGMPSSEGYIGNHFLRLYALNELAALNAAYGVSTYFPNSVMFGSNGVGSAYLFDQESWRVLACPFIPLVRGFATEAASSFSSFIHGLAALSATTTARRSADVGMEVYEITPIVFGGDPGSSANKIWLHASKHAEACGFWNKKYYEMTRQKLGG